MFDIDLSCNLFTLLNSELVSFDYTSVNSKFLKTCHLILVYMFAQLKFAFFFQKRTTGKELGDEI